MTSLSFHRDLVFAYGEAARLSALIRRVIARNPSVFTFHGTGTYIIGQGQVAIIDPGPADPAHIAAILAAVRNETVSHILITHTHRDHSPGAALLKAQTGAKTYGFGPHPTLESREKIEEGADRAFRPDVTIGEGDVVTGQGWTFDAVHTPGHLPNHLCFALREEQALFSGDHVMGWSTSVIAPPEGDMAEYLASLEKLLPREDRLFYPTHGPPVPEPQAFVRSFIEHRQQREAAILACLKRDNGRIPQIVAEIYRDLDPRLRPAAGRSVLAHLIKLVREDRVVADRPPAEDARFRLKNI
jgi:glyoxylase-like metal-dependent hydrolase (beta-lactamase superfamily II)